MPIQILMPALSPTMTEGNLAKWHKKVGDTVSAGDVIAEIETDKATMEVEAVDEGKLGRILVPEGTQGVAVNQPIAVLLEEGEDETALAAAEPKAKRAPAASAQEQAAPPRPAAAATPSPAREGNGRAPPAPAHEERIFASPLARRMAAQAGLDLSGIAGSGPGGRVVKADIEGALAAGTGKRAERAAPRPAAAPVAAAAAPAAPAARPTAGVDAKDYADKLGMAYSTAPNSIMRKLIARRLSEAKQTVPHFYLTIDCQVDALLKVRQELNARSSSEAADGHKLSVNDFVIRAVALTLRKVPAANASWSDDAIMLYQDVDVSVAVATPGGLITPIVRHADRKGLARISAEMRDLGKRARESKLKPEEYQGGTFSVSNLGMYGIRQFEAIINPPQGCILAVGTAEQRPVVKDGALAIATVMSCTLSVDHRVVDGAVGAEFLAAFRKLIEDPLTMLL